MKRLASVLSLLLFIGLLAFALDGAKHGELVRADYGSGSNWVDVTERVRSLIRGDTLAFRADNQTLGVDPRPGQAKTLRLQVREDNGNTQELSFQENAYVNVRVNNDNGSNSRAGSPRWGRPSTPRSGACFYRDGFNSDNFCLQAGESLGSLPSGFNDQITSLQVFGNAQVTLFKDTNFRGDHQTFSSSVRDLRAVEGSRWNDRISSIRIERGYNARGKDYNQGSLEITNAQYGAGKRLLDVTRRLKLQVRGDRLSIRVSNRTMGGDPASGRAKVLRVRYGYNGRTSQVVVKEGDTLNLPGDDLTSTFQSIRCESNNTNRTYCRADTRGGVRLSHELSSSRCIQGTTWGYDSERIWVDAGCRADFEMLSRAGAGSGTYVIIPSGTELAIRTNELIDSKTARVGQQFSALVSGDILDSSSAVAIPRGSDVGLVIRNTDGSDLVLDVDSLTIEGRRYVVSTADLERKGRQVSGPTPAPRRWSVGAPRWEPSSAPLSVEVRGPPSAQELARPVGPQDKS